MLRNRTNRHAFSPLRVGDPEFIDCLGYSRVAIGSRNGAEPSGALADYQINNPMALGAAWLRRFGLLDHLKHFREIGTERAALVAIAVFDLARAIGCDLAEPIGQVRIRANGLDQPRDGIAAGALALGARNA